MTTLADRLNEALTDRGISQSELAREIKITQGTVSLILQGKTRQSKHLPEIARRLAVSYDWLIGKSEDKAAGVAPYVPPAATQLLLPVTLPTENALADMFEGLLLSIDLEQPVDEVARELAQLLPIGLSQLQGPLLELPRPPRRRSPAKVSPTAARVPAIAGQEQQR